MVPLVKRDFPGQTALCVGLYAATMALMAALASGVSAPLSAVSDITWRLSLGIWLILSVVAALCWWPHLKAAGRPLKTPTSLSQGVSLWKRPIAWQVSMFMALQTMVFYTLIDWFPSIAASAGINATEAGGYLFAYQAIAVLANIGTSFAIKRLADQRGLGFFCSVAILIGVSGLLWAPNHALTWLLFAGVGAGMSMVTCLSLFGLRARDHVQAASLSAMAQCVGYGIGAAGPFTCGWLHDFFGGWEVPLTLLLIAAVLQVIFAVLAGRNRYV
ncbi:MFS transporter [Pseudomonas veronii]